MIDEKKLKKCSKCKKFLPANIDYFYRNKQNKDGFHYYCKECAKQFAKNHYWKKERIRRPTYRKSKINKTLILYFLKRYCEYGNYIIHYEFLYQCVNCFCPFFSKKSLARRTFTHFLGQIKSLSLQVSGPNKGLRRSQRKIIGIRLNQRGIIRFGIRNIANLKKKTMGE